MNDNKLAQAIQESKQIRDRKSGKNEARSTEKLGPLHRFFAEAIQAKLNNNLTVVAYGVPFEESATKIKEGGAEIFFPAKFVGRKKADIAITLKHNEITPTGRVGKKFAYDPIAAVQSKCIFYNYSQNIGNYVSDVINDSLMLRLAGNPTGIIMLLSEKPTYYTEDGLPDPTKKERVGREQLLPYLEILEGELDECPWKPNAMLLKVFSVQDDGSITFPTAEELGFKPDTDAALIELYNRARNIDTFLEDLVSAMSDRPVQI